MSLARGATPDFYTRPIGVVVTYLSPIVSKPESISARLGPTNCVQSIPAKYVSELGNNVMASPAMSVRNPFMIYLFSYKSALEPPLRLSLIPMRKVSHSSASAV